MERKRNLDVVKGISQEPLADPQKIQSSVIDLLRFPLAIMVVFAHMNPHVINLLENDLSLFSVDGMYNVVGVLFSHVIPHITVPLFFFISGFLFFANFMQWSWGGYKKKLKSRVKTLLIPYLLWNIIPFLLFALSMLADVVVKGNPIDGLISFVTEKSWHVIYDCNEWDTNLINWLGDSLKMTGPYDLPLWFLRDLMVVTFLTPGIYYAIKKNGAIFICILFVAYISRIWPLLPGFHISAFFFFSTGAYFALNNINIVQLVKKYKTVFLPVSLILLIITTIFDGTNTVIGQNVFPLFLCTGVFTAFYVASICVTKWNLRPNKLLVSSCFFIYAMHGVVLPIIGQPLLLTNWILHKIIPGNTGIEELFCYFACPFITAYLCILTLLLGRRFLPKLTLYFSGNK